MTFSIAFWSVFIGILASLIANYIQPHLGSLLGKLSTSYQNSRQEKQEKRNKKIRELAGNGTLLTLVSIKSGFLGVFFFLTFIVYLSLPPTSLFNMLMSLFFGLLSMIAGYRGLKIQKLVNEAIEVYKEKS